MLGKSLQQIAHILELPCESQISVLGFAIDSRKIEPGALFFALPGEKADGHQFLEQVAQKGACGAVVSEAYRGEDFGLVLLKVKEVRQALHALAKEAFKVRKETVVAITGSMGKTTTKEFVAELLSAKFRVHKTPGNWNSQLTLPLTLLHLKEEADILVLEMGMSQKGHIEKLVELAPPDIGVVTRIAPAGMEDFQGGLHAIASAKGEIFTHPKTKIGVISGNAARYGEILYRGTCSKVIYGWKEELIDYRLADYVMEKEKGAVRIQERDHSISPPLSLSFDASHLQENFLAAVAVGRILGLSWWEIQEKSKMLAPFPKRFEKIEREGVIFIQDCYNANPDSVCAALKNTPKPERGGRFIGVLGMMPDLGSHADYYHRYVGEFSQNYLDHVLSIGEAAKSLVQAFSSSGKPAEHFSDLSSIKHRLFELVKPGDVVLIKGSNSLKLWEILDT